MEVFAGEVSPSKIQMDISFLSLQLIEGKRTCKVIPIDFHYANGDDNGITREQIAAAAECGITSGGRTILRRMQAMVCRVYSRGGHRHRKVDHGKMLHSDHFNSISTVTIR